MARTPSQADALFQQFLPLADSIAIIRLSVLEGQSLRQIGQQLGISAMSVQRRRQKGLAALKAELA